MSNENVKLVRRAYEAIAHGDTRSILRFIDPDLEWTYLDPGEEDPEPQVCHGLHELEVALERQASRRRCHRVRFGDGDRGWFGLLGFVVAPDGTGLRRISHHYVEYPAWSPDGSRIAFMAQEPDASGSNPDYNLFVMNADGTDVRRLTDAPGEDCWPA